MEHSEQIDKLAKALNKVQATELFALKDKTNPFFKSKYADLTSVWDAIRQPLVENGLSIVQTFDVDQDPIIVTTLLHESGQWLRGSLKVPMVKNDPQAMGSAITYGRRYSISSIIGVCPTDDLDAEPAMVRTGGKTIDGRQLSVLIDKIKARSEAKEDSKVQEKFCKHFKIVAPEELLANDYKGAIDMLESK